MNILVNDLQMKNNTTTIVQSSIWLLKTQTYIASSLVSRKIYFYRKINSMLYNLILSFTTLLMVDGILELFLQF